MNKNNKSTKTLENDKFNRVNEQIRKLMQYIRVNNHTVYKVTLITCTSFDLMTT